MSVAAMKAQLAKVGEDQSSRQRKKP